MKKGFNKERLYVALVFLIRLSLILAIVVEAINFRWLPLFVTVLALLLTFLPEVVERRFKIDIPVELEIITLIFIYASIFLGEVRGYYTSLWWWDKLLHLTSGIALGFIGFMILYVLYKGNKIKASPSVVAFFSFCFALSLGAFWEIFEFAMDQIFGLNMQKSGLVDTMWDLIVDSIGALIASITGYFYLKFGKLRYFDSLVKDFKKNNPDLFK